MGVEVQSSSVRQVVVVSWDTEEVNGELIQLVCSNPDSGAVSLSGVSKNTGSGAISYPEGYSGRTDLVVADNDGNSAAGTVEIDGQGGASTVPDTPEIEPPDLGIWPDPPEGSAPWPEHPIVIPPDLGDDFWTGNLPPSEIDVPHPTPNE